MDWERNKRGAIMVLFLAFVFTFSLVMVSDLPGEMAEAGEGGTRNLGELEIGDRVVDSSWQWEYRTGNSYSFQVGDESAPVTWIVVAKNHYEVEGNVDHVTLLAEDLICKHAFDDSSNRGDDWGSSHWGDSGKPDAEYGLRPFLNSMENDRSYVGEGFLNAVGPQFKEVLLTTMVPNRGWEEGDRYTTRDKVFIPSSTELDEEDPDYTYEAGEVYPYFDDAGEEELVARLAGIPQMYWTRSPHISAYDRSDTLRAVDAGGEFKQTYAGRTDNAVRPVVNVSSETQVSSNPNISGEFEMFREVEALEREASRVFGEDRYETAVEISRRGWSSAEAVVLARGDDFPDALAGVPLAYELDAPILLTRTDQMMDITAEEIKRLEAEEVYILGGTAAISSEIESILEEEMGLTTERLGGNNRYHTAALIAELVAPRGTDQAAVVNGLNFKDALIASPYAAVEGQPVLLTREDSIPGDTAEALENLGIERSLVVGNTDKVTDEVLGELPQGERLSNPGHYSNAVEAARYFEPEKEKLYVATGEAFADALAGGVLAAVNNRGIMLVDDSLSGEVSEYLEEEGVNEIVIFGGEAAVSRDVLDLLTE